MARLKYWTNQDRRSLNKAKTYKDLANIALRILKRMPKPIGQVCGPISTGGYGNIKDNMAAFACAIRKLKSDSLIIFNQLPFETPMHQMVKESRKKYDTLLLTEFYLVIFRSRLVKTFYFLPNWKTSFGARWEHQQARRLKIKVIYLPKKFLPK